MTLELMQTVYYGPESSHPLITQKYLDRHTHSLRNEPQCRFVVAIDDELEDDAGPGDQGGRTGTDQDSERPRGRVIAAIKYYLVPEGDPHPDSGTQEVIDDPGQLKVVHGLTYENEALSNAFVGPLVDARRHGMKALGTHMLIDLLYTDPAHQRRGAGGMLMRHACREADDLGLPTMLEASPAGMSVYEAVGFRKTEWPGAEIWIDLKRWDNGGDKGQEFEDKRLVTDPRREDEWYAQIVMVRPAKAPGDGGKVPLEAGDQDAIVV
jgi:GNAT superfamily N-acetyltransferase